MTSTVEFARDLRDHRSVALLDELEQEVDDMSTVVKELQTLSLVDADTERSNRMNVDLSALYCRCCGDPQSAR